MSFLASCCAVLAVIGVSREPQTGGRWSWEARHAEFLSAIADNAGRPYDVVLLGDSLTERLPADAYGDSRTLNLGVHGDRIENLLWRLEHGELDGYTAKLFRLHIGTNNLTQRWTTEEFLSGLRQLVELISERHPEARIELVGLLPRHDRKSPRDAMERIRAVNRRLPELCDGEKVFLVDACDKFLTPQGKPDTDCFIDGLHLSDAGYRRLIESEKRARERQ